MLAAGVRWKWIEDNPAALVKNPEPKPGEIDPFDSWAEIDAIGDELDEIGGGAGRVPVRDRRAAGGGVRRRVARRRPRAADVPGAPRVREGPAEGLREDRWLDARRAAARNAWSTALEAMPGKRRGILFPAPEGGRIDINNWRNRFWTPSLEAAGVKHRRIYDLRHTYATWSLAAGIDIFTLARRMGTSVKMIDRTYGHLVAGADAYERELLDAFDATRRAAFGHVVDTEAEQDAA